MADWITKEFPTASGTDEEKRKAYAASLGQVCSYLSERERKKALDRGKERHGKFIVRVRPDPKDTLDKDSSSPSKPAPVTGGPGTWGSWSQPKPSTTSEAE